MGGEGERERCCLSWNQQKGEGKKKKLFVYLSKKREEKNVQIPSWCVFLVM